MPLKLTMKRGREEDPAVKGARRPAPASDASLANLSRLSSSTARSDPFPFPSPRRRGTRELGRRRRRPDDDADELAAPRGSSRAKKKPKKGDAAEHEGGLKITMSAKSNATKPPKPSLSLSLKRAAAAANVEDEDDVLDSDGDGDDDEIDPVWAGGDGFGDHDFSDLVLKPDHANRPLWICGDGRIFLESFSPVYKAAYDFLISVAEPVCRPANMHEYLLTPHSLYAAVSVGLETATILSVLGRLSKTQLSNEIHSFVEACTANYGKVKLVLQRNRFFLESPDPGVLRTLLRDETIRKARVPPPPGTETGTRREGEAFTVSRALRDKAAAAVTQAAVDATATTRATEQAKASSPRVPARRKAARDATSRARLTRRRCRSTIRCGRSRRSRFTRSRWST